MIMLHRDKDWLEKKYILEGLSLRAIADLAGVSYETVRAWLKRLGIKIRKKNDFRKKMSVEQALEILAEDTLVVREELLPDPEALFYSKDEVEQARAEDWGRYRKRQREELAARIKRENAERKDASQNDWHCGDAGEQMQDIQEFSDSVESSGKKPEKATKAEAAYIENKGS